jgi:hypothetical protein
MRPIDKIRNQDLPRGQGDHSTLYVSLELSRSTWLVTSLSPNSDKMSKHTIAAGTHMYEIFFDRAAWIIHEAGRGPVAFASLIVLVLGIVLGIVGAYLFRNAAEKLKRTLSCVRLGQKELGKSTSEATRSDRVGKIFAFLTLLNSRLFNAKMLILARRRQR